MRTHTFPPTLFSGSSVCSCVAHLESECKFLGSRFAAAVWAEDIMLTRSLCEPP